MQLKHLQNRNVYVYFNFKILDFHASDYQEYQTKGNDLFFCFDVRVLRAGSIFGLF